MNEHKHIWKFSNVPLTLQVSKKFPSFPSFRFQYKGQNQKLGNLENLQLPLTKQILLTFRVFRVCSFIIRVKIENLESSEIPTSSKKTIPLTLDVLI